MKEIKAYVRNNMVDHVIDSLHQLPGFTWAVAVSPLHEYGFNQSDSTFQQVEMTKLEVDLPNEWAPEVVSCILNHARTGFGSEGHPGDGKVFVSDVAEGYQVKDGSRLDAGS